MMENFFELVSPATAYLIPILSKVTIFYLSEIVQKYINLISSKDRLSLFPCRNKLSLLFFLQYKLGFFPILPSFLVEKVKLKVAALKNEKISNVQLKRVEVLQKCFAVSFWTATDLSNHWLPTKIGGIHQYIFWIWISNWNQTIERPCRIFNCKFSINWIPLTVLHIKNQINTWWTMSRLLPSAAAEAAILYPGCPIMMVIATALFTVPALLPIKNPCLSEWRGMCWLQQ